MCEFSLKCENSKMIYLVITSSINNKIGIQNYEHRKKSYIDSITQILSVLPKEIKPIIVENNGKRETYLDDFKIDLLYTDNNKKNYPHKGFNELDDIKDVISHYKIEDDDMIIKISGRYTPFDDSFFRNVVDNNDKYDSFMKFYNICTWRFETNDCILGLFATRCKNIRNFSYKGNMSPECEMAIQIRSICKSICEIKDLRLRCCLADDLRIRDV